MDVGAPLRGVRVLDFCWVLAGPLSTRILANFGADVIRIESQARLDTMRAGRTADGRVSLNLGPLFNDANTGKRSLAVDLREERGRDLVRRLVAHADVVTNNFRPGVLERIGFGYEALRQVKDDIILLNMPGCGKRGPWSARGTLGGNIMGASGLNSITGFPDRQPYGLGCAFPDFTSPYLAAAGILAALHERRRTGRGQELDLSQLSATVSLLGVELLEFDDSGSQPLPPGNRDPNYCPHGAYPTRGENEWCAVAVESDAEWAALCHVIGRPELIDDARFATHAARKRHEDDVDAVVSRWTKTVDRWQAADLLQAQGVAAAAVESLADTLEGDPQLRDHYQRVRQPDDPDTDIVIDGEAIRFAGFDRRLSRAPLIGEHSEAILCGLLGLTSDEFDELVVSGVVG